MLESCGKGGMIFSVTCLTCLVSPGSAIPLHFKRIVVSGLSTSGSSLFLFKLHCSCFHTIIYNYLAIYNYLQLFWYKRTIMLTKTRETKTHFKNASNFKGIVKSIHVWVHLGFQQVPKNKLFKSVRESLF